MLLHNENKLPSIPIGHSTSLKDTYGNAKKVLDLIKYRDHGWKVCGDLKIISILLGQQGGYTSFPCFLCQWNSTEWDSHNHWTTYPPRNMIPGQQNVIEIALVPKEAIIIPPLHLKLGIVKQFIKAIPKDEQTFQTFWAMFPKISDAKLQEGVLTGPDIGRMINFDEFNRNMPRKYKRAWNSIKLIIKDFLGNHKATNYKEIVRDLMKNMRAMGARMSYKLHLLHAHLEWFPNKHGERFHQDIKVMEQRYQGRWDINMMADYCWGLIREDEAGHDRSSGRMAFNNK